MPTDDTRLAEIRARLGDGGYKPDAHGTGAEGAIIDLLAIIDAKDSEIERLKEIARARAIQMGWEESQ